MVVMCVFKLDKNNKFSDTQNALDKSKIHRYSTMQWNITIIILKTAEIEIVCEII